MCPSVPIPSTTRSSGVGQAGNVEERTLGSLLDACCLVPEAEKTRPGSLALQQVSAHEAFIGTFMVRFTTARSATSSQTARGYLPIAPFLASRSPVSTRLNKKRTGVDPRRHGEGVAWPSRRDGVAKCCRNPVGQSLGKLG